MNIRSWRKSTWGLVIWTALIAVWLISGLSAASSADCVNQAYTDACEAGTAIGAGIGVILIGGLWFMGFIVGSIIWFASRPSK